MNKRRTELFQITYMPQKNTEFLCLYRFDIHPCIAGRLNRKAKVELPMRILDEISTYSNDFSYDKLTTKIKEINERESCISRKLSGNIGTQSRKQKGL